MHVYESAFAQTCIPNTNINGVLCPDSLICPCPVGADCYKRVAASDKALTVISFKLIAKGLKESGDSNDEAENIGDTFSPHVRNILNRTQEGSILEFTCIKAKNDNGQVLTLQPFTMILKPRKN